MSADSPTPEIPETPETSGGPEATEGFRLPQVQFVGDIPAEFKNQILGKIGWRAQDKALVSASLQQLRQRYSHALDKPQPCWGGDDEPPTVLQQVRADAIAALNVLLNAHLDIASEAASKNDTDVAMAWCRDYARLEIAMGIVEAVSLVVQP